MTIETKQFAEKILRATKGRDLGEVFPVKIGELRILCEALTESSERPALTDKQQVVYDNIKLNPGVTSDRLAKELGYAKALPLMSLVAQLAEKGYVKPVATEHEPLMVS
ncbi:MAG: hypothetical protein HGA87_01490 [Desulfobulbaceae bacterium]|nr:hypothetical protein [Desulfobulbaceae bacterium]